MWFSQSSIKNPWLLGLKWKLRTWGIQKCPLIINVPIDWSYKPLNVTGRFFRHPVCPVSVSEWSPSPIWPKYYQVESSSHRVVQHRCLPLHGIIASRAHNLCNSSKPTVSLVYLYFLFRLLLLGVCRVIKPTGPLDGLLGGRFLTAFAACLFTGAAKGALIGWFVVISESSMEDALFFGSIISLPPLFMAIFSTMAFSRNSFKIIIYKPELIIMPIGTYLLHIHTWNLYFFSYFFLLFKNEA